MGKKSKCCESYKKKGKMCSGCPLRDEKKKDDTKKKEKKKKKKKEKKKKEDKEDKWSDAKRVGSLADDGSISEWRGSFPVAKNSSVPPYPGPTSLPAGWRHLPVPSSGPG